LAFLNGTQWLEILPTSPRPAPEMGCAVMRTRVRRARPSRQTGEFRVDVHPTRFTKILETKESSMSVELTQVRDIFKNLESGDGAAFFTHVADDVDWIVEGTHPLADYYHSKADFWFTLSKRLTPGTEYADDVLLRLMG
jgi:hypothetical protein